ncbi:50S ribosomal protein L33 [Candidatus Beckwithbacteria bacterium]|nr:50S ribosomal protein L33 [Candidatus Beckwithbacteria bacterium]
MAKKAGHRIMVGLVCTRCKSRNYITQRNKINTEEKLVLVKYCRNCRERTDHKEVAKLK